MSKCSYGVIIGYGRWKNLKEEIQDMNSVQHREKQSIDMVSKRKAKQSEDIFAEIMSHAEQESKEEKIKQNKILLEMKAP
jgi:hypothetical protein